MKRKVLSLLLCGLLACSTLTACGGSDDSAKSGVESDVEVSKDDETGNKVEDDSNVSSEENSTIEPSIYTELTMGESSLEDTLSYLFSVTADVNTNNVTDLSSRLDTAYGKLILGYEGEAFFKFDKNDDSSYTLRTISHLKMPYSDSDDFREKGDALISYFDKLYTRGVYAKGENRFPAYLVKDSADSIVVLYMHPEATEARGYFIDIEMEYEDAFDKNFETEDANKKFDDYCWFDSNGNAYQPEFYKTNLTVDNLFSNIDEANIDLYTFHVQAPAEAQEAAPADGE
ncbi:unknown [Enterocloster bolteae CAG:59]|nr:unknown [Enterocloster bolteae CAG:59]